MEKFGVIEERDFTGIESTLTTAAPRIRTSKGMLTIESERPAAVSIFTTDGLCVCATTVEGKSDISLPCGAYVVRTPSFSRKVIVK